MSQLAPIALFVYARPEHTRQALQSLKANALADKSKLYIFVDGPKPDAADDTLQRMAAVKKVIREAQWCGEVAIIESAENKGLANSIIEGATKLVNEFGKVIILEDDLLLHKDFLKYMNAGLGKYEHESQVYAITGYQFPIKFPDSVDEAFFFNDIASWTWGTWKRAWDQFDPEATGWERLEKDAAFRKRFNFGNTMDYATMLEMQMRGEIDSWAIRWYWTVFQNNGFSLVPKYSLVKNIGFDGTGEHCNDGQLVEDVLYAGNFNPTLPDVVELDKTAYKRITHMWNLQNNHDLMTRIRRRLLKLFGKSVA